MVNPELRLTALCAFCESTQPAAGYTVCCRKAICELCWHPPGLPNAGCHCDAAVLVALAWLDQPGAVYQYAGERSFYTEAAKFKAFIYRVAETNATWLVRGITYTAWRDAELKVVTLGQEDWAAAATYANQRLYMAALETYTFTAPGYFVRSAANKWYVQDHVVAQLFTRLTERLTSPAVTGFRPWLGDNPNVTPAMNLFGLSCLIDSNPNVTPADIASIPLSPRMSLLIRYYRNNPCAPLDMQYVALHQLDKYIANGRVTAEVVAATPEHDWRSKADALVAAGVVPTRYFAPAPDTTDALLLRTFPQYHPITDAALTEFFAVNVIDGLHVRLLLQNATLTVRHFVALCDQHAWFFKAVIDAIDKEVIPKMSTEILYYVYQDAFTRLPTFTMNQQLVVKMLYEEYIVRVNPPVKECNALIRQGRSRGLKFFNSIIVGHVKYVKCSGIPNTVGLGAEYSIVLSTNASFHLADFTDERMVARFGWSPELYYRYNPNATEQEVDAHLPAYAEFVGAPNAAKLSPGRLLELVEIGTPGQLKDIARHLNTVTFGVV